MRSFVRDDGKYDSSLLPSAQLSHNLLLLVTSASIPAKQGPDFLDGFLGHEFLLEVIQGGHTQVELLLKMLSKSRYPARFRLCVSVQKRS